MKKKIFFFSRGRGGARASNFFLKESKSKFFLLRIQIENKKLVLGGAGVSEMFLL